MTKTVSNIHFKAHLKSDCMNGQPSSSHSNVTYVATPSAFELKTYHTATTFLQELGIQIKSRSTLMGIFLGTTILCSENDLMCS